MFNYNATLLRLALLAALTMLGAFAAGCQSGARQSLDDVPAKSAQSPIAIPEPVKIEHKHLHRQLEEAMQAGGQTGEAAHQVQRALADHFEEENRLVMPLLGLLAPLAEGDVTESMRPAIAMSKEVERKLPTFMQEHRAIHEAVDHLEKTAEAEGKGDVAAFARRLRLHAQTEEAVLYPAAILVGRQVEQALGAGGER